MRERGRRARATPSPGQDPLRASSGLAQPVARDNDPDSGALAQLALDFAEPAEECDALAHSEQTEVAWANAGLAPLLGLEAVAVVGDVDLELILVLQERDAHLVRGGVLLHVVERLDRDAVQRRLRLAR